MALRTEQLRVFDEYDVRHVLSESCDPTIELWAAELKRDISYWHVGTSSVSRVKISSLSADAEICTKDATTIVGTSSEFREPVETIGTTFINLFNEIPIKVHVTRSKDVAPFVVDGIIGHDLMETRDGRWELNKQNQTFRIGPWKVHMPALPGRKVIQDYISILTDRIRDASIAEEKGCWATASKKLKKLRPYLPPDVGRDNRWAVTDVLDDYAHCFYLPGDKLEASKLVKYPILSKGNDIINEPQTTLSQEIWDDIDILTSDLLEQGIISESTSPYNSPVRLQEEKPDSRGKIKYRIAVDFFALNRLSECDLESTPTINHLINELYGEKYFSVVKLASYQIELEPQDRHKTAFSTRSGHYEFQRMPVGIKSYLQYTQRLMNEVLIDLKGKAFAYYDEILIHSPTIEAHEVHLRQLLSRISDARLKLQPDKCQLFRKSVNYAGHVITDEGFLPDLDIMMTRNPDCVDDLQSYLSENLLLQYPNWNRKFIIKTSLSENGIQAVLKQKKSKISGAYPIEYASRNYTDTEAQYSTSEKEDLAYVWAKETFRCYLQHKNSTK